MFRQAFNNTIAKYGLTAKAICDVAGISQNQISSFRRGASELGCDKLWSIVEAAESIAPGAREYFIAQLNNAPFEEPSTDSIINLLKHRTLTNRDLQKLLVIMSKSASVDILEESREKSFA